MFPFCHGKDLIMAQFHIAEPDKYPICYGTVPDLWICKGAEPYFIYIRLHIQKQPAS